MLVRKSTLKYSISRKGLICANGRPIGLGGFVMNTILGKGVDQHSRNVPTHSWSRHFLNSKQRYYIPSFKVKKTRSYRSGHDRDVCFELNSGHDINFNPSCGIEELWAGNNFKTHLALSHLCPNDGVSLLYNKQWFDISTGSVKDNISSMCPAGIYFGHFKIYRKATSKSSGAISFFQSEVKGFLIQRKPLKDKLQGVVVFVDNETGRKRTSRYYTQSKRGTTKSGKLRDDRLGYLTLSKNTSQAFIYIPFETYLKFPYLLGYVPTNNVSEQDYILFTEKLGDYPACKKDSNTIGLVIANYFSQYPLNGVYMFGEKVNFSFYEPQRVTTTYLRISGVSATEFIEFIKLRFHVEYFSLNIKNNNTISMSWGTTSSKFTFEEFVNLNYKSIQPYKETAYQAYLRYLEDYQTLLSSGSKEALLLNKYIVSKNNSYIEVPANDLSPLLEDATQTSVNFISKDLLSKFQSKLFLCTIRNTYTFTLNPVVTKVLGLRSTEVSLNSLKEHGVSTVYFDSKPMVCNVGSPYYSL